MDKRREDEGRMSGSGEHADIGQPGDLHPLPDDLDLLFVATGTQQHVLRYQLSD